MLHRDTNAILELSENFLTMMDDRFGKQNNRQDEELPTYLSILETPFSPQTFYDFTLMCDRTGKGTVGHLLAGTRNIVAMEQYLSMLIKLIDHRFNDEAIFKLLALEDDQGNSIGRGATSLPAMELYLTIIKYFRKKIPMERMQKLLLPNKKGESFLLNIVNTLAAQQFTAQGNRCFQIAYYLMNKNFLTEEGYEIFATQKKLMCDHFLKILDYLCRLPATPDDKGHFVEVLSCQDKKTYLERALNKEDCLGKLFWKQRGRRRPNKKRKTLKQLNQALEEAKQQTTEHKFKQLKQNISKTRRWYDSLWAKPQPSLGQPNDASHTSYQSALAPVGKK